MRHWPWLIFIIAILLVGLDKVIVAWLILREIVGWGIRNRAAATVNEAGFSYLRGGRELPFTVINKLESDLQRNFFAPRPVELISKNDTTETKDTVCLDDRQMVALAKTVLNQWQCAEAPWSSPPLNRARDFR